MKKVAILLVVAFLGFYLFKDPSGAGGNVKNLASSGWDGLTAAFQALITFFNALTR